MGSKSSRPAAREEVAARPAHLPKAHQSPFTGDQPSVLLSECTGDVMDTSKAQQCLGAADLEDIERTQGFKHFLFLVGSGLALPIGQEPYASFMTTRVSQPIHRAASTALTGGADGSGSVVGGSSPRSVLGGSSDNHSIIMLGGASPSDVDNNPLLNPAFMEHALMQRSASPEADATSTSLAQGGSPTSCCAVPATRPGTANSNGGGGSFHLKPFSCRAARVVSSTLQQTMHFQSNFTATVIVSALDLGPGQAVSRLSTRGSLDTVLGSQLSFGGGSPPPSMRGAIPAGPPRGTSPPRGSRPGLPPAADAPPPPALPLYALIPTIADLRCSWPTMFIIVWHPEATEDAGMRAALFAAGANMVTFSKRDLRTALTRVACQAGTGSAACPWCGMQNLTPGDLYIHQPLYHIYSPVQQHHCTVCGADVPNLAVHIHEQHGPKGPNPEVRTGFGTAVVVHRPTDHKFLVVQEFAGQGFWTPGGGIDPGETVVRSAAREVLEETGVEVTVMGLLEVQFDLAAAPPWRLVVLYAQPRNIALCVPKTLPDFESAGACWVSADELAALPWRDEELPRRWFPAVAAGTAALLPLAIPQHAIEAFGSLAVM